MIHEGGGGVSRCVKEKKESRSFWVENNFIHLWVSLVWGTRGSSDVLEFIENYTILTSLQTQLVVNMAWHNVRLLLNKPHMNLITHLWFWWSCENGCQFRSLSIVIVSPIIFFHSSCSVLIFCLLLCISIEVTTTALKDSHTIRNIFSPIENHGSRRPLS